MIRAASELRQRCRDHPHRRATRACFRCKGGLCDQCVRDQGGQAICDHCQGELEELARLSHVPVSERVRRFGVSLRNFLIGVAVLGLLAIPASYVVRNLMSTPISPEEFARFRYAASGTFETPEGIMILSTVLGGRAVYETSSQPDFEGRRLIDEYYGPAFPGWRSADAAFPQEVVLETGQPGRIEKVILALHPSEPPETHVREFAIEVSMASPDGPFREVGRWRLEHTLEPQKFLFEPVDARWIKLRVLSNNGGPYAALAEMDAYVVPKGPFGAPSTPAAPAKR